MSLQKYHIKDDGTPGACAAASVDSCPKTKAGDSFHGELGEVVDEIQRRLKAEHGEFGTFSKFAPLGFNSSTAIPAQPEVLKNPFAYSPHADANGVSYTQEERSTARRLALESNSKLTQLAVSLDPGWITNGSSSVHRYYLQDNTVGYFKGFGENSFNENFFTYYSEGSSLSASISEVNAYRMSQLLGDGFDELVPETQFREVGGKIGTIQRGVVENGSLSRSFSENGHLAGDYRKAAIFDFVIGNLDRHIENFMFEAKDRGDGTQENRVRLIDNSFSFPDQGNRSEVNGSIFAANQGVPLAEGRQYQYPSWDLDLREEERSALFRARFGVKDWIDSGTITRGRGEATIERIDYLLLTDRIGDFVRYHERGRYIDTNVV